MIGRDLALPNWAKRIRPYRLFCLIVQFDYNPEPYRSVARRNARAGRLQSRIGFKPQRYTNAQSQLKRLRNAL